MVYHSIGVLFAIIGGLVLLLVLKAMLRKGWLLGWIKGTVNFVILGVALALGLIAWDVFSYQQLSKESSVATISFEQLGDQHYQAVLALADGEERRFDLKGDQWQLDARIFKWSPTLARLGMQPGYRLDRLSGRYYSLDKERHAERTVYDLNPSAYSVDVWQWFNSLDNRITWLDALYGSATFVPMTGGALYEIKLSQSGLLSRPLNEPAKQALTRWH